MSTETISKKDETFEIIKSAVNKLANTVKPTFGPASNKVVISKLTHSMVVDDGVQIARDFELEDPKENAVIRFVRETSIKTNDRAGDGTTGAMIILQAIINEVDKQSYKNGRKTSLELKNGLLEAIEQLKRTTKPIETKEDLRKVAMVSFDNKEISELIADLYFKLGKEAVITIAKSDTMKTYVEMSEGIRLNRGYISPYMIKDPKRMETVFEDPYILITDYRLTEHGDVLPIMEKMVEAGKHELVIISDNLEQNALATAVANRAKGVFFVLGINIPTSPIDRTVLLQDIANMTGAKVFSQSSGDRLEEATIEDLGRAKRFICKQEESIIVKPLGEDNEKIAKELKEAIKNETKEKRRKELEYRLGLYTGALAVIKVGAHTDNEQKTLQYKVEDAIHSVKSAFKGGVVCGAGLALSRITTSSEILNNALKYPSKQIAQNSYMEKLPELKSNEAYNVVTEETGEFMNVGVMDPTDVLIAGVESAVSIACILVTSSGMIVESRDKE